VTHEAAATGDVERNHDAIAGEVLDARTDGTDEPHRFMAENVAGRHEGRASTS
jgi:hypothetical protein